MENAPPAPVIDLAPINAKISKNSADIAALNTSATQNTQRLDAALQDFDKRINDTAIQFDTRVNARDKNLSAGIASSVALAMMPTPQAGGVYMTGGTGYFNGQGAVALGLTGASASGKVSYKIGASYTS